MQLDGPVTVLRWPGGAAAAKECVVRLEELETVLHVPFGNGVDHAEGISLFKDAGSKQQSLLVVFDSASVRRQLGESTLTADVYPMHPAKKSKKS